MMTNYEFKNGIRIMIPDNLTKKQVLERWSDTTWKMSIILNPPEPAEPIVRKEYTHTEKGIKARMAQYSRWKKVRDRKKAVTKK